MATLQAVPVVRRLRVQLVSTRGVTVSDVCVCGAEVAEFSGV